MKELDEVEGAMALVWKSGGIIAECLSARQSVRCRPQSQPGLVYTRIYIYIYMCIIYNYAKITCVCMRACVMGGQ